MLQYFFIFLGAKRKVTVTSSLLPVNISNFTALASQKFDLPNKSIFQAKSDNFVLPRLTTAFKNVGLPQIERKINFFFKKLFSI